MKAFKILCISLSSLFVLGCAFSAVHINSLYPEPTEHIYALGEAFTFDGLEITVLDCQIMTIGAFCEKYNLNNPNDEKNNVYCCYVQIKATNKSDTPKTPELYMATLGNINYSNGMDLELFMGLNNDSAEALGTEISSGESYEIWLPYTFWGTSIGVSNGNPFDKENFYLTFSLYPEKHSVIING